MDDPLYHEALDRFQSLLDQVQQLSLNEPTAVTLAAADRDGHPSARVVLLRGIDPRGFVFYTNSTSRKGQQLTANPRGALCFYWDALEQQVRVEGKVQQASDEESDAYWRSRARASQIGGWASLQSQVLDDRSTLESRVAQFESQFEGQEVPRPPHWYGFRVIPQRIEFWENRPARLHDRLVYELVEDSWQKYKLFP